VPLFDAAILLSFKLELKKGKPLDFSGQTKATAMLE
jgi:hypothetical protein